MNAFLLFDLILGVLCALCGEKIGRKMGKVIAMAGKGGTGKTTLSALIIRYLQKKGPGPILAVDADPSSNLADALGLPVKQSLGTAREDFFETKGKLPPGMTKETYLEMKLHEILVESQRSGSPGHGPPGRAGMLLLCQQHPAPPPGPAWRRTTPSWSWTMRPGWSI